MEKCRGDNPIKIFTYKNLQGLKINPKPYHLLVFSTYRLHKAVGFPDERIL